MNILFYSIEPFANKKPTGSSKYNQQHLAKLASHGHKCTLYCNLVEESTDRNKAINEYKEKGYSVESEEHPLLYIDKIIGEPFEVITFTYKSKKEISKKNKLFFIRLKSIFFYRTGSNILRNRKNLIHILFSALSHGKGLWRKLAIFNKWKYNFYTEPYFQAVIQYYKSINKEINPDYILMDGWVERMEIAADFSAVTELKKPKLIPVISTSIMSCFGPMAMFSSKETIFKESRIKKIHKIMDGFLLPSNYMKEYLLKWSSLDLNCQVVYPLIENDNKYLSYKIPENKNKYVTLINASNFKGLPIFIKLAKQFPDVSFLTVTTWGDLYPSQLKEMESLPNIKIIEPMTPVDPIYEMTHILLTPSLWDEAFGMVIVEAMLRGIPVLGSDVGGLSEAKLGVDFLLPVNPYKSFNSAVPVQEDITPWIDALEKLLSSDELYKQLAAESQSASRAFVEKNKQSLLIDGF